MTPQTERRGDAVPTATPAWFAATLRDLPERSLVNVDGVDIEVLGWGERGLPGILLLHGFTAHADWWSFIAPLLRQGRRVVAMSLSGMGGSGWRDAYSMEQQAREALAVAEASGLFEATHPPILIGHSYGSYVTRIAAQTDGHRLQGIVLVDGALAAREDDAEYDGMPLRGHRHRVYPTLEQALARFRFEPAQTCENPYIAEHIARHSLGPATDQAGHQGWSWRFDPDLRAKTRALPTPALLVQPSCRTALVFGDRSLLMTRERLSLLRSATPANVPWIVIPDAGHHIMVDQPLALVAALRALLAAWQPDVAISGDLAR